MAAETLGGKARPSALACLLVCFAIGALSGTAQAESENAAPPPTTQRAQTPADQGPRDPDAAAVAVAKDDAGANTNADASANTNADADSQEARRILDHVDDLFRGDSSHGTARMSVVTRHWQRTLEIEFWSRGKDRSLMRILSPTKEKGTATLRVGGDLWNYLPKVKRVIKLPSSMMSASWMGSHFTNDDLVKETRMADEYEVAVDFRGRREGVVEIVARPKPEAAVVWGRVLVEVHPENWMPLRIRYYDEDRQLARTMTYDDIKEFDGRRLPTRLSMQPTDKPEESTVVEWLTIDFDVSLPDDLFSLRSLQH